MTHRLLAPLVIGLGLCVVVPAVQADMPPNYDKSSSLDLSQYLQQRSDAQSQSFNFGGWNEHKFTVKKAGRYLIESASRAGMSDEYRIKARLLDAQGNVVARSEALGTNGGLHMTEQLEPGDYVVKVYAREFGNTKLKGNRYTISVSGLGAQGQRLSGSQSGIDSGSGILFDKDAEAKGPTTAFVRSPEASAALAAPAVAGSSSKASAARPSDTKAATANDSQSASQARPKDESRRFKEVVTDVDMNFEGKALSFDVVQRGTVAVNTSTMVGAEGSFQIEARVLDDQGNVVASDEGSRFAGNVHIKQVLPPGHYTVWVKGHNYGNAKDSANNFALRVKQLDTR
ncbi:hypothetical protein KGQ90_07145 [Modicisalibacter tunisiensis]|uniref:hypothetical protein n=1 Tax=Modicisalibacter tunisiensis TaxID=390637 RepID=UPI001CC9B6CF|nr:hypothetical protein [Modicisalibacter tunisiensis]MBZ9538708.1 hypothetical protein [Modicisalibacter tunisiensis]